MVTLNVAMKCVFMLNIVMLSMGFNVVTLSVFNDVIMNVENCYAEHCYDICCYFGC
jgi:hypothetical protein